MNEINIVTMKTEREARRVSEFFLSEQSFDDQHHTPGEIEHFRNKPLESLGLPTHQHWYVENEEGDIVGAISVTENEHKTGGYLWDYIVVRKDYRKRGIANRLYETLLNFVKSQNGRYILTYTCDLQEYSTIRRIFQERGFEHIGSYPDYYYEGEGRMAFLKKL
ncbi:GNAT family N-acetyltransferase [Paenibacillus sp. LMG 31456]|uniref:GNAT family N-acetyltransferase n=1 Tax=Paenibacillus foliorum TaxID=2654974 RepID=A0A972K182_9BACL|nr:GNAT family N-acetyltransferase [Paenibacillus foliorum]NOU93623.1 GNAT family N-acetyltransferase [Paenibacillus foliorum]